jgi:hypothetical protein
MFESSSLSRLRAGGQGPRFGETGPAFVPEAKRGASARQVPPSRAVPNQRATAGRPRSPPEAKHGASARHGPQINTAHGYESGPQINTGRPSTGGTRTRIRVRPCSSVALPVRIPAGPLQLTQSRIRVGAGRFPFLVEPRQHEAVVTKEPQFPACVARR